MGQASTLLKNHVDPSTAPSGLLGALADSGRNPCQSDFLGVLGGLCGF